MKIKYLSNIYVLSIALLVGGVSFLSNALATHAIVSIVDAEGTVPSMFPDTGLYINLSGEVSAEHAAMIGEIVGTSMATPSEQKTAFVFIERGNLADVVLLNVYIDQNTTEGYKSFRIDFYSDPDMHTIPSDFTQININKSFDDPRFITQNDIGSCSGYAGYFDLSLVPHCSDNFHIMVKLDVIPEPTIVPLLTLGLIGMLWIRRRDYQKVSDLA